MTSIFEDFTIAIAQPSRYGEFLKRKKSMYALFIVILVILTSLANVVYPSVTMARMANEYFSYHIPYFKIENGKFFVEKEYKFEQKPLLIKLSNSEEFDENSAEEYQVALLCDEDKLILKNNAGAVPFYFKDAGYDFKFEKNDVNKYKNIFINIIVVSDIIMFIFSFAIFFLGAFFVQILTKSFLRTLKLQLSREEHFKLCVYSRAMPSLLCAVLTLFNFGSLYIISIMISVIYIYNVFVSMKRNEIKKDTEE